MQFALEPPYTVRDLQHDEYDDFVRFYFFILFFCAKTKTNKKTEIKNKYRLGFKTKMYKKNKSL